MNEIEQLIVFIICMVPLYILVIWYVWYIQTERFIEKTNRGVECKPNINFTSKIHEN
jgi:hypothetical protein